MDDNPLPDHAVVCRGGLCLARQFERGSGVSVQPDGTLDGISVNASADATFAELTRTIPHQKVGRTTAGAIRSAGGAVAPHPNSRNSYHCVMSGLSAQQAQELFTPSKPNPNVSE